MFAVISILHHQPGVGVLVRYLSRRDRLERSGSQTIAGGGTDKCAPARGVDEKSCHVPAQVNSPLKIRPDGFIRPSAPRGKVGGVGQY